MSSHPSLNNFIKLVKHENAVEDVKTENVHTADRKEK